jgi:ABC-type transporter Mla maintaining outer membrane lipid asymmetry ATPase subunit MlaF
MRSIVRSSLQFRYLVVVIAVVMKLAGITQLRKMLVGDMAITGIDSVGLSASKKNNLPGGIRYAINY